MRIVLVDHMDDVLREALAVSEPEKMFGPRRLMLEYVGGQLVQGDDADDDREPPSTPPTPAPPGSPRASSPAWRESGSQLNTHGKAILRIHEGHSASLRDR